MWEKVKALLAADGSWTVYFARAQVFLGVLLEVLVATDMTPFIKDQRMMTAWLVFSGVMTEVLRRRREGL